MDGQCFPIRLPEAISMVLHVLLFPISSTPCRFLDVVLEDLGIGLWMVQGV